MDQKTPNWDAIQSSAIWQGEIRPWFVAQRELIWRALAEAPSMDVIRFLQGKAIVLDALIEEPQSMTSALSLYHANRYGAGDEEPK